MSLQVTKEVNIALVSPEHLNLQCCTLSSNECKIMEMFEGGNTLNEISIL